MKITLAQLLLVVPFLLSIPFSAVEQTPTAGAADKPNVVSAASFPALEVAYQKVAQFKLASRKAEYHLGELITLDAATLNRSNEQIFLLSATPPSFELSDLAGKKLNVVPYGVIERAASSSSFTLTDPADFVVNSSTLLIGCDEEAFAAEHADSALNSFQRNLFVSRGTACLMVQRPGVYYIKATLSNKNVVVSSSARNKTAVGEIESNVLRIKVVR